jgi:magnesium-transporting ATPase (P-type)
MKNEDDCCIGTEFDPIVVLEQAILSRKKMSDKDCKAWMFGSVEYYGYPFGVFAFVGILWSVAEPWLGEAGRIFSEALKNNLFDWYIWLSLFFMLACQCAFYAITGPIDTTILRGRLRLAWDSLVSTRRLINLCVASFIAWGGYAFGVLMFVTLSNVYKEFVSGPISINSFSAIPWPEMQLMWVASVGIGIVLSMRLKTIEWVNDPRRKTKKPGLFALLLLLGVCTWYMFFL